METFLLAVFLLLHKVSGDQLVTLGGSSTSSVGVIDIRVENIHACPVSLPDVPQPYGAYPRMAAYSAVWDNMVYVCGGISSGGPPISSYKDCQVLDLYSRSWSSGPSLVNYTSYGASAVTESGKFFVI